MSELTVWLTTVGYSVLSALVPVFNAEAYLIAASALAPSALAPAILVAGTLGQMAGKVVLYYAGRGAVRLPGERIQRALREAEARLGRRPGMESAVLFSSATLGLPPFYLVTLASGMMHLPLPRFVVLGLLGRLLRNAVVVALPQLLRGGLG
jgi:membrane protein YqaA with SNARE-associated domain